MALNPNSNGGAAEGMYQAVKDSEGIFGSTNKSTNAPTGQGKTPEAEYRSSMDDEEILSLVDNWRRDFAPYYEKIKPTQEKAFHYWLGKQNGSENLTVMNTSSDPNPLVDNVIFTAVETFLPLATRANPDPVVTSDPSDEGETVSHAISAALVYEADRQKLRRKLARMLRRWSWDRLGVVKISWDYKLKELKTEVIPAKRFIFDKDGYVDEGGRFRGEYLGEKKRETAGNIIMMFAKKDPELKAKIEAECQGKLATKLDYVEWWYRGRDVFFTLGIGTGHDQLVLGKFKNPNWNYDIPGQEAQEASMDEEGNEIPAQEEVQEQEGINFHKEPQPPYVFLSIFSSGTQPYDETSLILQNTQLQDIVNRRTRQIDKNVGQMNTAMILSGKSFDVNQATNAATALEKGQAILAPDGDVRNAAMRFAPTPIPDQVFEDRDGMRAEIMNIYGTAGSTPQGMQEQKQVRGKIMASQADTSRIGGTITETLEQVADSIYNFWVQFMFVYYDEPHFVTSAGIQGGTELIQIHNSMFPLVTMLDITVKEGSLIPKDPLTKRNEAMDLWSANAIDPIKFYKRLDEADPVGAAEQLMLWEMAKAGNMQALQAYLPDFPLFQQQGAPTQAPPGAPQPPIQGGQPPMPTSPPAVEQQSHDLIKSVPI